MGTYIGPKATKNEFEIATASFKQLDRQTCSCPAPALYLPCICPSKLLPSSFLAFTQLFPCFFPVPVLLLLLPCSYSCPAPAPKPPAPTILLLCSCLVSALLPPFSGSAPALLLPCSCSTRTPALFLPCTDPPQSGNLHHHQHLTTFLAVVIFHRLLQGHPSELIKSIKL